MVTMQSTIPSRRWSSRSSIQELLFRQVQSPPERMHLKSTVSWHLLLIEERDILRTIMINSYKTSKCLTWADFKLKATKVMKCATRLLVTQEANKSTLNNRLLIYNSINFRSYLYGTPIVLCSADSSQYFVHRHSADTKCRRAAR